MTAFITKDNNPDLWTILSNELEVDDGWIVHDGVNYRASAEDDGMLAFIAYATEELYDSRSVAGKPASYTKLDG